MHKVPVPFIGDRVVFDDEQERRAGYIVDLRRDLGNGELHAWVEIDNDLPGIFVALPISAVRNSDASGRREKFTMPDHSPKWFGYDLIDYRQTVKPIYPYMAGGRIYIPAVRLASDGDLKQYLNQWGDSGVDSAEVRKEIMRRGIQHELTNASLELVTDAQIIECERAAACLSINREDLTIRTVRSVLRLASTKTIAKSEAHK